MDYEEIFHKDLLSEEDGLGVISFKGITEEARFKVVGGCVKDGKTVSYKLLPINQLARQMDRMLI